MTIAEKAVDILLDAVPPAGNAGGAPAGDDDFNDADIRGLVSKTLAYSSFLELWAAMGNYDNVDIGGDVSRSGRYVHENSTSFTLRCEPGEWYLKDGEPLSEQAVMQFENLANTVEEEIGEQIIDINKKIYKELEAEYDYQFYGDGAEESITANDYTFDVDGDRSDGDDAVGYRQLTPRAKTKAKEWFAQSSAIDSFWSEYIIDEWKDRLEAMGFSGSRKDHLPDISWSGFSSQGDGASFTCNSFDFAKYVIYLTTGKARDIGL